MNEYQIGGGLRLLTAVEKTDAFGEFLKTRMVRALETEDPTELHYLLAQLDDYHSYMWRYYKKLAKDRCLRGVSENEDGPGARNRRSHGTALPARATG
jgi:hypothetical protein